MVQISSHKHNQSAIRVGVFWWWRSDCKSNSQGVILVRDMSMRPRTCNKVVSTGIVRNSNYPRLLFFTSHNLMGLHYTGWCFRIVKRSFVLSFLESSSDLFLDIVDPFH